LGLPWRWILHRGGGWASMEQSSCSFSAVQPAGCFSLQSSIASPCFECLNANGRADALGLDRGEMQVPVRKAVPTKIVSEALVKHAVADRLRAEIASGALRPGARIVEGTWARRIGVAQGSIREAINLLDQEGFVTKASGRSARVVTLSENDVLQMYEIRGALEGLAARLLAQKARDLTPLEQGLEMMRRAMKHGRPQELIDGDLKFHLELCRLSGNAYLFDHARKVLLPLFAFVRILVLSSGQETAVWGKDLEAHQRILDLLKEGQGEVAEQYIQRAMARFAATAYDNWEKKPAVPKRNRR
jgi:DNA-binding GntR family transcriptional regulator